MEIRFNEIEIHLDESENYIQINDCHEDDLRRIWSKLRLAYPGYEVNFFVIIIWFPQNYFLTKLRHVLWMIVLRCD